MHRPRWNRYLAVIVLAFCACPAWAAQDFPTRPLHLIVTFPPGGAADLMARILARYLGDYWKQPVIVDNKPGANGSLGTDYAARQPADGYTFLVGNMGPSLVNPLMMKVPYDTRKNFITVSLVATAPCVLVVNANSPYKTLKDLVDAARAHPGQVNFGSGGTGTLAHLGGEMLDIAAGIKMQHVPYKGGIQAVNDVLTGQIDLVVADMQPVLAYIKAGKLRALAITSAERSKLLPDVPTFAESGMKDLVAINSWALYLPAGTPSPIVARYDEALQHAMTNPGLVKLYGDLGMDPLHTTSQQAMAFNQGEIAKYGAIIKEKNIHVE
jgi:tripartite-type tricarboxylate transporter receptor subunit TctC